MRKLKLSMPNKYDKIIHASVIVLIVLGTLMIASTSVGETAKNDTVVLKTIIKQSVFVIVSYIGMVLAARIFTLEKATKWARPVGFLIIAMLVSCFFFEDVNGAQSWIRFSVPGIGQMTIQPSEFMKVFMIVMMACVIEKVRRRRLDCWSIVKIPISFYAMAAILILLQNDLGSLIVITLICAVCLLIPSHPSLKKFQKFTMIGLCTAMVVVLFLSTDFGMNLLHKMSFIPDHIPGRFETAANPWEDSLNNGYQLINSLYAFASGGWKGLGFGQSVQKMMYLPEAMTDYILAITVEELGITGFLIILGGYGTIVYRLFKYALMSKREGYKILYVGTAMYLVIHFVFNVGGVTGLIPLTGIPLLFISSGASSLLSICVAIGICQSALARENREREEV